MKIKCLISTWVCSLFTACGGGGDSSAPVGPAPQPLTPPPAAAQVTLNYGIKQLQFSWAAVSGATSYKLMERPEATGDFVQVGNDLTATNINHDVTLHRRINAAYRIDACNSGGCTPSSALTLAPQLVPAIGYVKASNTEAGDFFGQSVAVSADGDTLAIGASSEASNATGLGGNQSDNSANGAGAVYVFTRDAGVWSQQAYVKASNTGAFDSFGVSVALSADGNTLAVGASSETSNATGVDGNQSDNSADGAGAVYVFTRTAGTWSQQAYVKASNTGADDHFGISVTLSADGNTLAVGASSEASSATGVGGNQSNNAASGAGAVYVFTRSAGIWSQQAYVKASNTGADDHFGFSVALSADSKTLAVGALSENSNATGVDGSQSDNSANAAGAVYVFTRSAGIWSQQAYVKASNTGAGDHFGVSVALGADGNTLAVGANSERSASTGVGGNQGDNSADGAGAVYVFTRTAGTWSQQTYVKASNTGASDAFGLSVALSADGNTLAVGASFEASNATGVGGNQSDNSATNAGAVYVFTRTVGIWSQQAYVKASIADVNDGFSTVALSGDGSLLAVGAKGEASAAAGIGANQSDNSASNAGAVYLF